MIKSIVIDNVASFKGKPVIIDDLNKLCFFYGANGSGKTTISKIINDINMYSNCRVNWDNGIKLTPLVYNKDFKDQLLQKESKIRGVFTLGKENVKAREQIDTLNKQISELEKDIAGAQKTLDGEISSEGVEIKEGLYKKLKDLEGDFTENCWKVMKDHEDNFKKVFTGFMGSKVAFREQILKSIDNEADLKDLKYLKDTYALVFQDDIKVEKEIALVDYQGLTDIEKEPLFLKVIVGSQDIDIAGLIEKLGSSDWVRKGYEDFYKRSNKVCPFCQQNTSDKLMLSLEEYFGGTYQKDIEKLKTLKMRYDEESITLHNIIVDIPSNSERININELELLAQNFEKSIAINKAQIDLKIGEPSRTVKLDNSADILNAINELIRKANLVIRKHNELAANLEVEKDILKKQVWKYLVEEKLLKTIKAYNSKHGELKKKIDGLNEYISKKTNQIENTNKQITKWWIKASSTQPTADAINATLQAYGFTSFSIARDESEKYYEIVRENNEEAKNTLSEGEMSFITFLYFYNYINGTIEENDIVGDRILVFDDPVSSLDNEILFIVSHLIQDIMNNVVKSDKPETQSNIKQVIVFTHNVYFYRQVTFLRLEKEQQKNLVRYWIITKNQNSSIVTPYATNPIKSSYQLLWSEYCDPATCKQVLPNVMRRILEHYFTFLGGLKLEDIGNNFVATDKQIFDSLIKWTHDGSHSIYDDIHCSPTDDFIDKYKNVFHRIFIETEHKAHYDMMVKEVGKKTK